MKKALFSLLSLALVLCMALTFTACKAEDEEGKKDTIVGDWTTKVDLADAINANIPAESQQFVKVDKFELVMNVTFNEDGTFEKSLDEAALAEAVEDLKADILGDMKVYIEGILAQQGITMSFEDYLAASGVTEESLMSSFSVDTITAGFESKGTYEIDEDKIYMLNDGEEKDDDKYETFELDGDKLTFKEAFGLDEATQKLQEELYPLEFTRVK